MKRDPKLNPRPGDRVAKVLANRRGVTGVFSRAVLALEKGTPHGTTVVYTRKRANRPCRCSLTEWRRWARGATSHRNHEPKPVLSRSQTALSDVAGLGI